MKADIVVKGIIFNKKLNKLLLIQRSDEDPVGADTWENAGGSIECGEDPEAAVRREIREETGITDIAIRQIAYVTLINANDPFLIIAYLCETQTEDVALSDEHQAFIWADRNTCKALLPKEIIADFEKNMVFEYIKSENSSV